MNQLRKSYLIISSLRPSVIALKMFHTKESVNGYR